MELHNLQPAPGATKARKRIGRGQGSARGGTATRGHKGAQSRSGYKSKPGFEGGQMPLARRVPKGGFTNRNRTVYKPINLAILTSLASKASTTVITPDILKKHGLLAKHQHCKILAQGTLEVKLDVTAHAFSSAAKQAIETQGGTTTIA